MYTTDEQTWDFLIEKFRADWRRYPEFSTYVEREWIDKKKLWSNVYRLYNHNNINTNNLIESWHKKLKYYFLEDRPNRRVDRLIYLLIHIIIPSYHYESVIGTLNIGRMKPQKLIDRRTMLLGKELLKNCFMDDIGRYHVISQTNTEIIYDVEVDEDTVISCSCPNFLQHTLCKHMAAVSQKYSFSYSSVPLRHVTPTTTVESTNMRDKIPRKILQIKKKIDKFARLLENFPSNMSEDIINSIEEIHNFIEKKEKTISYRIQLPYTDIIPSNSRNIRQLY